MFVAFWDRRLVGDFRPSLFWSMAMVGRRLRTLSLKGELRDAVGGVL